MKTKTDEGIINLIPETVVNEIEKANTYHLLDGTVITVKNVLTRLVRIEGQTGDDGHPSYLISTQAVVVARPPDDMPAGEPNQPATLYDSLEG